MGLSTGESSRPTCKCHGVPMKPAQNHGGWRCVVKHRETRQDWWYGKPGLWYSEKLLRNRRRRALQRMKARAA